MNTITTPPCIRKILLPYNKEKVEEVVQKIKDGIFPLLKLKVFSFNSDGTFTELSTDFSNATHTIYEGYDDDLHSIGVAP